MLTLIVFLPAMAAAALLFVPASAPRRVFTATWAAASAIDLALVLWMWARLQPGAGFQFEQRAPWIPSAGISYHVGAVSYTHLTLPTKA